MDGLAGYFSNIAAPTDGAASVESYGTSTSTVAQHSTSSAAESFVLIDAATTRPLQQAQPVATESSVASTEVSTTVATDVPAETVASISITIQPGSLPLDATPDTTGLLSESAIAQQLVAQQQTSVPPTVQQLLEAVTPETVANSQFPSEFVSTGESAEIDSEYIVSGDAGLVLQHIGSHQSAAGLATSEIIPQEIPVDDSVNQTDTVVAEPIISEPSTLVASEFVETTAPTESFVPQPDVLTIDAVEFETAVTLVEGISAEGQAQPDDSSSTTVAMLNPTVQTPLQNESATEFDQSISASESSVSEPTILPERTIGTVAAERPTATGGDTVGESVTATAGATQIVPGEPQTPPLVHATETPNSGQNAASGSPQPTASMPNAAVQADAAIQPAVVSQSVGAIDRAQQTQPLAVLPEAVEGAVAELRSGIEAPASASANIVGDQPIESLPIDAVVSRADSRDVFDPSTVKQLADILPANGMAGRPGQRLPARGNLGQATAADPVRSVFQSTAVLNSPSAPVLNSSSPSAGAPPLTSQILSALVQQHSTVLHDNAGSLTLRLDPPELGQLDVKFTQGPDGISVRVSADQAVTMEMLLSRGGEIERMLLNQNSDFVKVEFAAPDSDGRSDQSSFSNTQQDGGEQQSDAQDHPSFSQHQTQTDSRASTRSSNTNLRRTTSRVRLRA
ncbi:MAG: hypothetical protein Fues2KO_36350 [Fuerstiella sp.]